MVQGKKHGWQHDDQAERPGQLPEHTPDEWDERGQHASYTDSQRNRGQDRPARVEADGCSATSPRKPLIFGSRPPGMDDWQELTLRATVVLLVTSAVLIGPGLVGVGASLPFIVALVALGVGLAALRSELSSLPTALGHDLGEYARDLWLAPFLAAVLFAGYPDASPAELQALGGFAGFVGMVNYFLRPVYLSVFSVLARTAAR